MWNQPRANADGVYSQFHQFGKELGITSYFPADGERPIQLLCRLGHLLHERLEDGPVGHIVVGYKLVITIYREKVLNQVICADAGKIGHPQKFAVLQAG